MPWQETNVMEERIKFVAQALRRPVNFSQLCRDYGIARKTGYKWVERYFQVGHFADLREKSRRPHHSPDKTDSQLEAVVLALRDYQGWGARKIRVLLLRGGIDLPERTISRIIKRNGRVLVKHRDHAASKRFERSRPNELWQMDFKGESKTKTGWCYPLSILDDHSRFAIGVYALACKRAKEVYGCMLEVFDSYGVPDAMLMDHGVPWWSPTNPLGLTWLSVSLIRQGIKLHFSGKGHPQTQGKVERFHRTLQEGVMHKGKPETLAGYTALFGWIREQYNHVRPHESLDMAVPASRYQPSGKAYNPNPPDWVYPAGLSVCRLNSQGCIDYRCSRYFVCEALAGQRVGIEEVDNKILVTYRHMYIREIDLDSGRSKTLVQPKENDRL